MPLVTSGQFAYVYKLKSMNGSGDFAVRCFRGYLGDRDQRYRAIQEHLWTSPVAYLSEFSYAPEGILVGGNRFPILFMKWIDGPTLDLYIGEMLQPAGRAASSFGGMVTTAERVARRQGSRTAIYSTATSSSNTASCGW